MTFIVFAGGGGGGVVGRRGAAGLTVLQQDQCAN